MKEENFWKTPRGKAIIKLSIWGIFFIILIAVMSIGSPTIKDNPEEETETYKFVLYSDMLNELLKNNYEFEYSIITPEETYIYSGKTDGTNTLGIKESKDGIVKYFINSEGVYKVVLNNLETYNELYLNLDSSLINLDTLFNNLKGINYKIEKEDDKRKVIYDTIDYTILIKTDLNNILSIEIVKDNVKYNYGFSNIGDISKVNYTN